MDIGTEPKKTDEPFEMDVLEERPQLGGLAVTDMALDQVVVAVSVELGRVDLRLATVKGLRQGETVSLGKAVGEPLDLLVNGALIARGEVVAVEGQKYGLRITDVVASGQRSHP